MAIEYKTVTATPLQIDAKVNELLAEGWALHGVQNVYAVNGMVKMAQAMTRDVPDAG